MGQKMHGSIVSPVGIMIEIACYFVIVFAFCARLVSVDDKKLDSSLENRKNAKSFAVQYRHGCERRCESVPEKRRNRSAAAAQKCTA
jgi:hypothetical protein